MDYGKLKKKAIVLDFDGTICRLFENYDLQAVSNHLRDSLVKYGVNFEETQDCFNVFDVIKSQVTDSEQRKQAMIAADEILQFAECQAVNTAVEISGIKEFLDYCKRNQILFGVATNNSPQCIRQYLKMRELNIYIPVYGRNPLCLEYLKPNPWSLNNVIKDLGVSKEQVLFLGDNPTDLECSLSAGVDFIAIASTEKKKKRFERAKLTCEILENYYELLKLCVI